MFKTLISLTFERFASMSANHCGDARGWRAENEERLSYDTSKVGRFDRSNFSIRYPTTNSNCLCFVFNNKKHRRINASSRRQTGRQIFNSPGQLTRNPMFMNPPQTLVGDPSPRETACGKNSDCVMNSQRSALVRGSDPP